MKSLSHLTWVRGLKQAREVHHVTPVEVAPYVGAWVETYESVIKSFEDQSHLTWVRGLKPLIRYRLLPL